MRTTQEVEQALRQTGYLVGLTPELLKLHPGVVPTLRMSTCPPIAVDRLVGLAGVSKSLVECMEGGQLPVRMDSTRMDVEMNRVVSVIRRLADPDIFTWLEKGGTPTTTEVHRAATIVADRLTGAQANPIIRNAQEQRQLAVMRRWLDDRGYVALARGLPFDRMPAGTYAERLNVPVRIDDAKNVNIPIDLAVMPRNSTRTLPIMIEAKSAGDFTNVNKRRKEEAQKMSQLRGTHGAGVNFTLFLCGYFDSGYLGYEAAEGIDWIWEHRIDDLAELGL